MLVCQAGTSLIQPQSNSTVPPRLGSLTASTPCSSSQLASSTIATQWAPVRFATGDRVGHVVGVAVADRDVGRLDLLGGRHRGRVVGLEERVDQHGRLPLAQLEARVAVELDLHLQLSPSGLVVGLAQLLVQCPADGDSNHHPHPRLLGEQGADRGDPLVGVGDGRGLQRLGLVRLAEPAALGERRRQHLLQLRRRPGDDPSPPRRSARRRSAARSRPRAARRRRAAIAAQIYSERAQRRGGEAGEAADRAADEPGEDVGGRVEDRQREQDRGGDRDADQVVLLVDRARAPRRGGSRTRRRPRRAPSRCRRRSRRCRPGRRRCRSRPASRASRRRPAAARSATLPRRRSRPIAKIARPTATTNR